MPLPPITGSAAPRQAFGDHSAQRRDVQQPEPQPVGPRAAPANDPRPRQHAAALPTALPPPAHTPPPGRR